VVNFGVILPHMRICGIRRRGFKPLLPIALKSTILDALLYNTFVIFLSRLMCREIDFGG
jgi:hypothetical protein